MRKRIVDAVKYMDGMGLNYGGVGSVSARVGADRILITPSGAVKSAMTPEDIVLVNLEGEVLEGRLKPTPEVNLHLEIYRNYSHFNAVIHAYPVYASTLAVARRPLPPLTEEFVLYTGGEVRVAGYAPFGTRELAEEVVKALRDRSAALLANRGVITCGRNLEEALEVLEVVERMAHIYILAHITGWFSIPKKSLKKLQELYHAKYSSISSSRSET